MMFKIMENLRKRPVKLFIIFNEKFNPNPNLCLFDPFRSIAFHIQNFESFLSSVNVDITKLFIAVQEV